VFTIICVGCDIFPGAEVKAVCLSVDLSVCLVRRLARSTC